jgi:hypothetical protein
MVWAKGQSGNVKGRPAQQGDPLVTDALRKAAVEVIKSKGKHARAKAMRRLDRMAQAVWRKAEKADMAAVQFVTERLEGKVAQPVEGRHSFSADDVFLDLVRMRNGLPPKTLDLAALPEPETQEPGEARPIGEIVSDMVTAAEGER